MGTKGGDPVANGREQLHQGGEASSALPAPVMLRLGPHKTAQGEGDTGNTVPLPEAVC